MIMCPFFKSHIRQIRFHENDVLANFAVIVLSKNSMVTYFSIQSTAKSMTYASINRARPIKQVEKKFPLLPIAYWLVMEIADCRALRNQQRKPFMRFLVPSTCTNKKWDAQIL